MLLVQIDLLHMKTVDIISVWNPEEWCVSALNNALCSASLFRVATEKDIEKETWKMKITKALMNSNPPEEIKQAYVESVDPTIM